MAENLYTDTVVIGGGTAGAAVAARLAQDGSQSVLLLESGPDYGAFAEQHWPVPLLDARSLPGGHDWGYINGASSGRPGHLLERARVMGGCSSHNGCAAIWGSRADYDGWAASGLVGIGAYTSLTEVSEHIVKIRERTEPDPATASMYTEAYERYRQTYFAMLPVFEEAAERVT